MGRNDVRQRNVECEWSRIHERMAQRRFRESMYDARSGMGCKITGELGGEMGEEGHVCLGKFASSRKHPFPHTDLYAIIV